MGKPFDTGSGPDDILDLIADVHTDTPAEEDRLDRALGTLESTHRRASAAMQRFERTGRTGPQTRPQPQGSLSFGAAPDAGPEPEGKPSGPRAGSAVVGYAPASTEVTQVGLRPQPILGAPPPAEPQERTQTAIARPQKPIPVAEVLSGRGAEFVERGHTKTHIVHRAKNLPKK